MTQQQINPGDFVRNYYSSFVQQRHPNHLHVWPLLSGSDFKVGTYRNWIVVVFTHTGNPVMSSQFGIGELSQAMIGEDIINFSNKEVVRERVSTYFNLSQADGVVLIDPTGHIEGELEVLHRRHEIVMGLAPMKIFLSHRGSDKQMVRRFKSTLDLLGFETWLDEDDMHAGIELERGILKGFLSSCASVFFITPSFRDKITYQVRSTTLWQKSGKREIASRS